MVLFSHKFCLNGLASGVLVALSGANAVETNHHVAELDFNENVLEGTPVAKILSDESNFPRQASDTAWSDGESRRLKDKKTTLDAKAIAKAKAAEVQQEKDAKKADPAVTAAIQDQAAKYMAELKALAEKGKLDMSSLPKVPKCGKGFKFFKKGGAKGERGIDYVYTCSPTSSPTNSPTPAPTPSPTPWPSPRPTPKPTLSPTPRPTRSPTRRPTPRPTQWSKQWPGYTWWKGHRGMYSPDGRSRAWMDNNGDFYVHTHFGRWWHVGHHRGVRACFQSWDNHFLVRDGGGRATWTTDRYHRDRTDDFMYIQNDGNWVQYRHNWSPLWDSGTWRW